MPRPARSSRATSTSITGVGNDDLAVVEGWIREVTDVLGNASVLGGLNYPPCFWLFWAQFHDFWGLSPLSKTGLILNTEEKKEFQTSKMAK